ncbi:hypothetical protein HIF47_003283 [Escherichia coli]|nr:hypothetical protein [Escherichia coli]EFI3986128.1 hypothetical protein [Escherichia coli]EFI4019210.1 hypothetical protein [Escherichia coli]EFI9783859.1 hypothetical protein [Escherichia coli]HAH5684540.1 hypothetical protein [Escherichia coli]
MRVVYAGCGVNALSGLQTALIQCIAESCRPDKRSTSGNFAFVICLLRYPVTKPR